MTTTLSQAPRIVDLADRILDDIRRKKLRPGDPYLSTAEIARLLRVSGTAANRALQLLGQRRVLERRQRRGTFIAAAATGDATSLQRVHLLVHHDYLRTEGLLADGVVLGIQGELPQAEIQFNFLPDSGEVDYVQRLVQDCLRDPRSAGFVLVRSSVFTQRLLAASGLPTVVSGTLHPSIQGLATIDRDQRQIGRLMVDYMLKQKCRRIALLLRDHVGAGDHVLLDTVSKELASRGFAADALVVRCLPADTAAAQAAVAQLIGEGPTPVGVVCRSQPLAQGAAAAVAQLPRAARRQTPIALCDTYRPDGDQSAFPCIVPLLGPQELGREIGRLLKRQVNDSGQPAAHRSGWVGDTSDQMTGPFMKAKGKETMRAKLCYLVLALGAVGGVWFAVRAAEPERAVKGDVKDVRIVRSVEQHPGAALLWEPYIAEWKPKHLVVAFGAGIPGKTDMGDILASVSTDDGDRWSEPVFIFDHQQRHGTLQFGYANPVLFKPPGQDVLWCFAMRCPMNYQHSEDSQLAGAFSGDGGRSWTPVELAMHYTGPLIIVAGIHRIVENGQPRYLLPAHRNTRRNDPLGSRDQFMLSSTSLLEWRLAGHIPQPESGRIFLHEGGLAPGDAAGELKLVMRTARDAAQDGLALDPPRAFSSVSKDGGRTWSPAQQEPELWNSVAKAFYGRTADGTQLYVYNDGPAWSRMALRYKTKPQGGAWSAEQTFYDAGTHNSYPTLIEVAPGDFRAVWDSGTASKHRTHIRFAKFRVAAREK